MANLLENVPLMSVAIYVTTLQEQNTPLCSLRWHRGPPAHKHKRTSGAVPAKHIPATAKQQNIFISYWKFNPFFYLKNFVYKSQLILSYTYHI